MATPLQQPSSPSATRQLQQRQPSPTSPSYAEHQFKRTLLDDVKTWSEIKVTEWLSNQSLGRFNQKFKEHNITGSVLLDLDYEAFKAMDIKTVGERVRLLTAIKALRQECYLAATLAARTPTRLHHNLDPSMRHNVLTDNKHEGYNVTSDNTNNSSKISKSSETSSAKSLLNRSNSFSRFLGRSDSKRSQRGVGGAGNQQTSHSTSTSTTSPSQQQGQQQQNSDLYSLGPSSPRTLQKRNSLEGGIMSMEKVKQMCVKVFGEDGQTRIVNVHTANESKTIMAKILHKFGIDESSTDSYCIFVGSSTNGEARALTDQELIDICRSTDRPEKERLILRKRHMYPTHEEFKRKGTINASNRNRQYDSKPSSPLYHNNSSFGWQQQSNISLNRPDYLSHRASQAGSFRSQNNLTIASNNSSITRGGGGSTRRRFFGERPPSEVISSNLQSFFPNHNREILETAGIKAQRLSMTRRNSALSRMEPRNYRNSVLPELVSVLGVDLDKFLEEEEEADRDDYDSLMISSCESSISSSDSENSEDEEETQQQVAEKKETHDITSSTTAEKEKENDEEAVVVVHPAEDAEEKTIASPTVASPTSTNNNEMAVPSTTFNQKRSSSLFYLNEYKSFKPTIEDTKEEESEAAATSSTTTTIVPSIRELTVTPPPSFASGNTKPNHPPKDWMKGSLIGRGTFGDVYLGLNPISGELMAVKQVELPVENSASEKQKKIMVEALRREIELLRELEHENIVQYLGSTTDDSYFSIFLEYVPGGSVAGLLSSYGAFQEPLVKSFVRQILKGLNYLHGKDIVHRDIKGANVLVDNKGGVKITDFGISKKVEEDIILQGQMDSTTHRMSLQGSIYWMAPEVVKQTQYTRKADIWSLGCMVVEMFTGDHPFPEYSQMQAIFQIGCYTAPNIPSNLSPDAQDFLKCTFQLKHEERPSADELLKHPFLFEQEDFTT